MLARRQSLRSLKAGPLEVEQVVGEHRLAFHQVQRVAVKASPLADDHTFGPALRHVDVGRDGVGGVEYARLVAVRDTDGRTRIIEDRSARRLARTRCDEPW